MKDCEGTPSFPLEIVLYPPHLNYIFHFIIFLKQKNLISMLKYLYTLKLKSK